MLLVGIIYLLLCVPVTVHASVGVNDRQSACQAALHILGIGLRFDGIFSGRGIRIRLIRRYGGENDTSHEISVSISAFKRIKPYLRSVLGCLRFERLNVAMRVGLDDAAHTAVAAGAFRAFAASLFSMLTLTGVSSLNVQADFSAPCFLMTGDCIFQAVPGDIMLAVVKTAVKKTRREGFKWSSTPSRA